MDSAVPLFWTSHGQLIGRVVDASARVTIDKIVPPLAARSRVGPWESHRSTHLKILQVRTKSKFPPWFAALAKAYGESAQFPALKCGGQRPS